MTNATQADELTSLLSELEGLLHGETVALKRLDREAIDEFASRKIELLERLGRTMSIARLDPNNRSQLARLHKAALMNQLLLVHARDAVRGTLAMLVGENTARSPSSHPTPTAGGMRVDVRG